ncbi:hypothetical protein F5887DRAFT_1158686 [Amanita rubescens]|nr:hypothetical protein F5887DRAFT_1158686 [Amanita rubescens]
MSSVKSPCLHLRFSHQTEQAAKGTRTSTTTQSLAPDASALSERQRKGVGTGLERAARWKNAAAWDSIDADAPNAGNSANAAAAAKTAWTKALKRRQELFRTYDLPIIELGDARINSVSILHCTSYHVWNLDSFCRLTRRSGSRLAKSWPSIRGAEATKAHTPTFCPSNHGCIVHHRTNL